MGQNGSSMGTDDDIISKSKHITKPDNDRMNLSTKYYEHRLLKRSEHIDFDVESWYKHLQNETFYTEFLPISPVIARAFVNYYQTRYNSKQFLNIIDVQSIELIQDQLKQQIFNSKTNKFHINGTFIRLSARSPKDGNPLNSQMLIKLYQQELNILQAKYPSEYDSIDDKANMQMIAYCAAQFHCLKVTNECEALTLILSSERIFIDLLEALDCQDVQDNKLINAIKIPAWNNNIIIREWNHLLDPSMEFRCFVYQSKLTAISQYNHYCKFYHLQNNLIIQQIKTTISQYWHDKVKPLLVSFTENYIVDIGLIKDDLSDEFQCIVIELNPFASSTGASLFDWKIDIKQLTGEEQEIEIRVRSDYFPNISQYIQFVFNDNQLNTEENSLSNDTIDHEPYFVFLNKIKTQLCS